MNYSTADSSEATKVLLRSQKNQSLAGDKVPENNDVMPFDQPSPKPTTKNNNNNSSGSLGSFSDHGVDHDHDNESNTNDNNKNDNSKKKTLASSLSFLISKSAPNSPDKKSSIMNWIKSSPSRQLTGSEVGGGAVVGGGAEVGGGAD